MSTLYDAASGSPLGDISDTSLAFLIDHLEEENAEDRDYYINEPTVDMLAEQGAPQDLIAVLRKALTNQPELEIRYSRPG